jgi:hypothetical protein
VTLSREFPAILAEQVVQPDAERGQFLAEPVNNNLGLIQV